MDEIRKHIGSNNTLLHHLMITICFVSLFPLFCHSAPANPRFELNTSLMECTFKIQGERSVGTAFIMGHKSVKEPHKIYYVLVTADHVLKDMKGNTAQLILRKKTQDGTYERFPYQIQIRKKNEPLWVWHEEVDVAAMQIALPENMIKHLVSTNLLANDSIFNEFGIHPGDKLMCLGYPLAAEANEAGFPILRSGEIASYPLTPAKKIKKILYDVEVYKGNSGGPVYFVESGRTYKGGLHVATIQFIAGIISKERMLVSIKEEPYKITKEEHQLGLAEIIPAIFIKETIEKLWEGK